jgi:hypothetical protein
VNRFIIGLHADINARLFIALILDMRIATVIYKLWNKKMRLPEKPALLFFLKSF